MPQQFRYVIVHNHSANGINRYPETALVSSDGHIFDTILCLNGEVSPARASAFLIASRMKLETVEENLGFWRALDASTVSRHVRALVEDGIRTGAFASGDAALLTRAILGACNSTTRWYRPGGRLTPARIAETYADYLVRGLLP